MPPSLILPTDYNMTPTKQDLQQNEFKKFMQEHGFEHGLTTLASNMTIELFGETYIKASWWTESLRWLTFIMVLQVFFTQIPLFILMVVIMQFEWILALFMSTVYLLYPAVATLFLFNYGLEKSLLTVEKFWSIWFALLFQVASLFIFKDLLVGKFADFFEIPRGFWSNLVVEFQTVTYALELIFFSGFVISLSVDYGILL